MFITLLLISRQWQLKSCKLGAAPTITPSPISISLVPRPSPSLVFDHLQYAKTEGESKTEGGEGLGTRLISMYGSGNSHMECK